MMSSDLPFFINIEYIKKSIPNRFDVVVRDFKVARGEIIAITGPNGSGKTTFIRMLCGVVKVDECIGECMGIPLKGNNKSMSAKIGYMTQSFTLYEMLTVAENIRFIASVNGYNYTDKELDAFLEKNHLLSYKNTISKYLSVGWKQQLSLAACLSHNPELLILDEPTAGMDLKTRLQFLKHLQVLANEGRAILFISHNLDEVEYCDRAICFKAGGIVLDADINEFRQREFLSIKPNNLDQGKIIFNTDERIQHVTLINNQLFFSVRPQDRVPVIKEFQELGSFSSRPYAIEEYWRHLLMHHQI